VIFVIAFGALALGGLLIVIIARYGPREGGAPVAATLAPLPAIPYDDFRVLLVDLLEALGLEIVLVTGGARDLDIVARSTAPLRGGRYLVRGAWAPPGDVVPPTEVLRLHDAVRAEAAAKGILLTPYRIGTEGIGPFDATLELVDGARLRDLVAAHLPRYPVARLDGYRGFGAPAAP
jgi:hypothetical protein